MRSHHGGGQEGHAKQRPQHQQQRTLPNQYVQTREGDLVVLIILAIYNGSDSSATVAAAAVVVVAGVVVVAVVVAVVAAVVGAVVVVVVEVVVVAAGAVLLLVVRVAAVQYGGAYGSTQDQEWSVQQGSIISAYIVGSDYYGPSL